MERFREDAANTESGNTWRVACKTGIITGLFLGTIFGLEICGMGDLLPYPVDTFLFVFVFSLFSVITSIILFLLLGTFLKLILRRQRDFDRTTSGIISCAGIFIIIFSQALSGFFILNRPVSFASTKIIMGGFIIFILSLLISYFVQNIFLRIGKKKIFRNVLNIYGKIRIWLPSYLILLAIIATVTSYIITRVPINKVPFKNVETKGKVLLLGVDAACWDTLLTLIKAGKLPNFERLIKEGASGRLPSLITTWGPLANSITYGIHSPAVWNSIFTGKSPFKHGIKDFFYTEIPGIRHPFRYRLLPSFIPQRENLEKLLGLKIHPSNRLLRKSKAVWNILSDAGLKVGALGWWMTWPAEEINGNLLSDRFADPNLPWGWYPQNMVKQADIDSLLAKMLKPSPETLGYFTRYSYDARYREHFEESSRQYMLNELLQNLLRTFYVDEFRSRLGQQLLDRQEYFLMAVYFFGLDVAGHAFTRFKYPELFVDVKPEEVEYFGEIIDQYHEWIDSEIGKYLERVDQNTTVLICSDHGMGPWLNLGSKGEVEHLSGSHRKDGIVILWGNHIRKRVKIEPKNVLDILPTILYLMGFPYAQDMDGAIIKDAIEPEYLSEFPMETITTYETHRYSLKLVLDSNIKRSADKKLMDRLRSLGYIK